MKSDLVIFDCDGTLMDSELIIAEEETAAFAESGIKIEPREFLRLFAGQSSESIRETLEAEFGRHLPDDVDKAVPEKINQRLSREVKAIDGAHAMLDTLDRPRCICSNSSDERLKIELKRAGLWDRFRPYVFSARDLDGVERKPAPDVLLYAASEFDADPSRCVVIEDSVPGVMAAKSAGMRVIGFSGGCHTYAGHADVLTDTGAETVLNRLADLPATVEALESWEGLDGVG